METGKVGMSYAQRRLPPEEHMIVAGIVLLLLGFLLKVAILTTIGIILVIIGAVLWILGASGRAIGGRRHYW